MMSSINGSAADLYRLFGSDRSQLSKLDEAALLKRFDKVREEAEKAAVQKVSSLSESPLLAAHSSIEVDGKVVARIDNQGGVKLSNEVAAKIGDDLAGDGGGKIGPALAQARAEDLAGLLGGEVVPAETAISQNAFDRMASVLSGGGFQALQKSAEATTLFIAQQVSQEGGLGTGAGASAGSDGDSLELPADSAVDRFLDYMSKTPEERLREAILKDMDMTEEQLAALPPEERAKVEEEIQQRIEERLAMQRADQAKKEAQEGKTDPTAADS